MSTHDLSNFDSEAKAFIANLAEHGWTGRVTGKGDFLAKAPGGGPTLTVPKRMKTGRGRNGDQARTIFKRWLEADPTRYNDNDRTAMEAMTVVGDLLARDADGHLVATGTAEEIMLAETVMAGARKRIKPVHVPSPEPILRETPWLARKSPSATGGTLYESEAVIQRDLVGPDGTVESTDYRCAFEGCGYNATKPRSVAAHYGKAHTMKGEAEPAGQTATVPGVDYVEPMTTRDYTPTQRLLDALSEFLEGTLDLRNVTAEELALTFLTWSHDRPDLDHETREAVVLTDEQIVARIRSLVWSPVAVDLGNARDAVAKAERERDEAIAQRDEIAARMAKVERDLQAFRDLAGQVGL